MTPQHLEVIEQYKKNYGVKTDVELLIVLLNERHQHLKEISCKDRLLERLLPSIESIN